MSCMTVRGHAIAVVQVYISTRHGRRWRKHARLRLGHVLGKSRANEHDACKDCNGAKPVEERFGEGRGLGDIGVYV